MKSRPPFITREIAIVAFAIAVGGYLRMHGLFSTSIENLLPDEARIGLGTASILRYRIPILNYASPHEPPLSLYFPIPFHAIWGPAPWTLKAAPILFGLATIVMTYLCAKEIFSKRAGFIASFFIALLPFHITYSRILYEHSFLSFFSASILFCYARHLRTGRPRPLYAAAILAGMALSTKIIYLYFIIAFVAAVFVSGPPMRPKSNFKQSAAALAILFLASVPFLLFVLLSIDLFTILRQTRGGGDLDSFGVIYSTLIMRMHTLDKLFTPALKISAVVWLLIAIRIRRKCTWALFLITLILFLFIATFITVSGLADYHMLFMIPAPLLLPAGLIDYLMTRFNRAAGILSVAVFVSLSYMWKPALDAAGMDFETEIRDMTPILETLPLERTIASQKDITMIHTYLVYMETGKLPNIAQRGIISPIVNRFSPCRKPDCRSSVFKDIDELFRNELSLNSNSFTPWNAYSKPDFLDEHKMHVLENLLLHLVMDEGYQNFIIDMSCETEHPTANLNRGVEHALQNLHAQGIISFSSREFHSVRNLRKQYRVISIDNLRKHKSDIKLH